MKTLLLILSTLLFTISFSQNGLHFDKNGDLVQTTFPGILGNNDITVEAWIKPIVGGGEK